MRPLSLALGLAGLLALAIPGAARADEAGQCQAQGGTLLTGQLLAGPQFVRARQHRLGVALSHTRLQLRGDDGQVYDIRADNVFAAGYDEAGRAVPAPLSGLAAGARLELCGRLYEEGDGQAGMDWVHSNCGAPPSRRAPDGWLKLLAADGRAGRNLEDSEEYCGLWP